MLAYESTALSLQLVIRERQKLEEELQIVQSTQTNINKAVQNLNKEKIKTLQSAHQKENEAYAIENEIASAKITKLNLQVVVDQLRVKSLSQISELREKESTITKYQNDIRQRNDEIEKKVYRVDRLNKKFDRMYVNYLFDFSFISFVKVIVYIFIFLCLGLKWLVVLKI